MFDFRLRMRAAAGGLILLGASACTGSVEDPGSNGGKVTARPGAGGQNGGAGGSGGTTKPPPGPACKGPADPGPAVFRRLSRHEFDRTVNYLFGLSLPLKEDFPVEERVGGFKFDNNAEAYTVSPRLAEQYLEAAERVAADVVELPNFKTLIGCDPDLVGADACAATFLSGPLARKIYRRPPTPDEVAVLKGVFDLGKTTDFKTGMKLVLMTMLQSPRFLYRMEFGAGGRAGDALVRLDPYETATRLSYLVWGFPPDTTLLDAAAANRLSKKEEIAAQVDRLLFDKAMDGTVTPNARARSQIRHFYEQWLEIEKILEVEKDTTIFKRWNKGLLSLFQGEAQRFVDDVFWSGEGGLRALFTARHTFVNEELAKFYGASVPVPARIKPEEQAPFTRVEVDGVQRGGLLSQGAFLAIWGKANQTSPVHRGLFVREQLLCSPLPPPPNDVAIEIPALDPTLTTRERFAKHEEVTACKGCHQLMDRIGVGFENYDAIGAHRTIENGKPIDASGEVVLADRSIKFNGVMELEQQLSEMPEVSDCMVRQVFRFAFGRLETEADACTLAFLRERFAAGGHRFRDLLVALTETEAFLYKRAAQTGGAP